MTKSDMFIHENSDIKSSAIESPLVAEVSNIQVQQRQILAMMGVEVWTQRNRHTVLVDYDALDVEDNYCSTLTSHAPTQLLDDSQNDSLLEVSSIESEIVDHNTEVNDNTNQSLRPTNPIEALKDKFATETAPVPTSMPQNSNQKTTLSPYQAQKIAPFGLFGARYKNWVLLVDELNLKEEGVAQLWYNLSTALSLSVEHLQFPICDGIQDIESANASVAGFVFRIAKTDRAQLATLTPLPEGINHANLVSVPYLKDMLKDSDQKKKLWTLLNSLDEKK